LIRPLSEIATQLDPTTQSLTLIPHLVGVRPGQHYVSTTQMTITQTLTVTLPPLGSCKRN